MAGLKKKLLTNRSTLAASPSASASSAAAKPALPTVNKKLADQVIAAIRKKVKGADVQLASDGPIMSSVTEWIPTGFVGLDLILGGGWPIGRASEVAGEEGCGKSALAQMACVQCQRLGGFVVYLDFEHALDPGKMAGLGLNPDGLLYHSPDYIEQAWDVVWATLDQIEASKTTAPTLIVWDSVGGSLAKSQLDSSAEDAHVGAVARAMTPQCARLFKRIARVHAHMLFVNQERAAIGKFARFGPPPKSTTGGAGLKYAASIRLRCSRVMTLKAGGNTGPATGYLIRTSTDKNRLVPPHRKATWVLDFTEGPSEDLTIFEALKDAAKIVATGGGQYTIRGLKGAVFTRQGWSDRLRTDDGFRNHAHALYVALIRDGFTKAAEIVETD